MIRVYLQQMISNITISLTRQVEIGVISQIDYGWLCRCCLIFQDNLILVCQAHRDGGFQLSRITLFAVGGSVSHDNRLVVNLLHVPNTEMEASQAAM